MKRYYSLYKKENNVDIFIYGDITSWVWDESDVSSYTLSKELQSLDENVENINVYINSYGGEVAEGTAIYTMLKRHKAKVTTHADGFVCSIATVIFAAGDERIVYNTSMGFYHNAWTYTAGNANDLRKEADDLEKITQLSINAYMEHVTIEEDELKKILDGETWLNANEMISMGFATKMIKAEESSKASQSAKKSLMQFITKKTSDNLVNESIDLILQKLEEKLSNDTSKNKQNNQIVEQENKPLNMMKAFLNAGKEE